MRTLVAAGLKRGKGSFAGIFLLMALTSAALTFTVSMYADLNAREAAALAAEQGFDAVGTTLSVSPYQYTDVIREELERAASAAGVRPLFEDYRPFYDEATHRSRSLRMYRQNYCGCRFSDAEAAAERAERKAERAAVRKAEAALHAAERAAAEAERIARKAERAAYDAKQARKRAVLKALRDQERSEG